MADKKRAVEDGQLVYTSVSQVQRFSRCNRQWFFRYVLGLPDKPPSKGQLRGLQGHERLAAYLKGGPNTLDRLERLGVERGLVPEPGSDLLVESSFGDAFQVEAAGVPFVGFVDLVNPRELSEGVLLIVDWKFKKSLEQYASGSNELKSADTDAGVQMVTYAKWAGGVSKDIFGRAPDSFRVSHVTFQTLSTPDVAETAAFLHPDEVHSEYTKIEKHVEGMKRAAKETEAHAIAPNYSECDSYGGCPYRAQCLDKMAALASAFRVQSKRKKGEEKMFDDEDDKPKTKRIEIVDVAPETPALKDATPPPPKGSVSPEGVLTASRATKGARYLVDGVEAVFSGATELGGSSVYSFKPGNGAPMFVDASTPIKSLEAPKLLPDDAPKSRPELASRPPASVTVDATPPPSPAKETTTAPPQAEAPDAPKKRGRKPKADVAEAEAPNPVEARPVETKQTLEGVRLFFSCVPIGGDVKSLGPYVESLDSDIRASLKNTAPDLRCSIGEILGYEKWKGIIAKMALERPPPPGDYLITYGDSRVDTVAETLSQILPPGAVIRGIK